MNTEVLIIGYTEFITDDFLATAFPDCRIMLTGKPSVKKSAQNRISVYREPMTVENCRKMFRIYEFDQVVFVSSGVEPFGSIEGSELDILATVLSECQSETQVLCLVPTEHTGNENIAIIEKTERELCYSTRFHTAGVNVVITPWIYNAAILQKKLCALFEPGEHLLEMARQQRISFVASEDMATLIKRIFENWETAAEPFNVPNKFCETAESFASIMQQEIKHGKVEFKYGKQRLNEIPQWDDMVLRKNYMWFPVYSIFEDIPILYEKYEEEKKKRARSLGNFFRKIRGHRVILCTIELIVGFLLTELILKLSGVTVQFNLIDFRLLYIMIMGIMYNMGVGMGAAFLETLSIVYAYSVQGMNWMNLFYDPTNWLVFIAYFTVGAVCGYIRTKDNTNLQVAKDETESITERYLYLSGVVEDILQEKKEYKQQIIGSRDSFGKIFNIVQQLESMEPQSIMNNAVEIMESVLENHSVAIYSMSEGMRYGRLLVSSRGQHLPFSAVVEPWRERLAGLREGEAWINKELEPNMPSYMFPVRQDGQIMMIIMLWNAGYNQMTLYYANLFKILGNLISGSLIRAQRYREAAIHEECIEGTTSILRPELFRTMLSKTIEASEKKLSVHLLLEVDCGNVDAADAEHKIRTCIRSSDTIGLWQDKLYVILMQATKESMPFIGARLEKAGIRYNLIEHQREAAILGEKEE